MPTQSDKAVITFLPDHMYRLVIPEASFTHGTANDLYTILAKSRILRHLGIMARIVILQTEPVGKCHTGINSIEHVEELKKGGACLLLMKKSGAQTRNNDLAREYCRRCRPVRNARMYTPPPDPVRRRSSAHDAFVQGRDMIHTVADHGKIGHFGKRIDIRGPGSDQGCVDSLCGDVIGMRFRR